MAEIADGRKSPLRQLHGEPGGGAGEQSVGALDGLWKSESLARGLDGSGVSDFGLDGDDVTQVWVSCLWRSADGKRLGRSVHDFVMMFAAHSPTPMPKSTIGQWDMLPVTAVMQKAVPIIAATSPNKPRVELGMKTCSGLGG